MQLKKPPSAFHMFATEKRDEIYKLLGERNMIKAGQKASELWKELSAADKEPFEAKAKTAKEEYEKALSAFRAAGGVVQKITKKSKVSPMAKKTASPSGPAAPKRPSSAFAIFASEKRGEIYELLGERNLIKAGQKASELWKELSAADKEPFEARSKEAKDEYSKAKAEYEKMDGAKSKYEKARAEASKVSRQLSKLQRIQAKTAEDLKAAKTEYKEFQTPKEKAPRSSGKNRSTPAKKAKLGIAEVATSSALLSAAILEKAGDLAGALKNLASRPELSGFNGEELFEALRKNGGLVNKAKATLLAQ